MKICLHTLYTINKNYIGGVERFMIKYAKEMKTLGHDVFIVCSSLNKEINIEGIKVLGIVPQQYIDKYKLYNSSSNFISKEILNNKYSVEKLRELSNYCLAQIADIEADIFHFNSFASNLYIPAKKKYFVTNHENEKEYDSKWGVGFFNFMSSLIKDKKTYLHNYDNLYVPSIYYSELFSKLFDLKISSIKLGIHLEDFQITRIGNKNFKEKIKLLFPSRFRMAQKGHIIALKACKILKDNDFDFEIIFTGVKEHYKNEVSSFLEKVNFYNLTTEVKIKNYIDIREAYEQCDIVISAERFCSYGLSISESLSYGIPTFLSAIPTYQEIALNYAHAYFFEPENPSSLAKAIIDYISNSDTKKINNEMIRFRINNDLRECAKKYNSIYNSSI
ncbi:glycosyltransferase family 4 protein [Kordia sp.]|uniref:glycosyltransferase family 4 protein n=1 Tax=Kordia sp. TaxID=1965332 RepID=UPI003D2E07DB